MPKHKLSNEICFEIMRSSMGPEHTLLRVTHRPHASSSGWQSRTKPRCFVYVGQEGSPGSQTLTESLKHTDGPCQPKPANSIPVLWPQHKEPKSISLSWNQYSQAPLSTSGELESHQSKRRGISYPLTSVQGNIISLLPSLCPRFIQLVRNSDGVPTPLCVVKPKSVCFGK